MKRGTAGFGPVVQEEVRRLPEKYRAVVVLCYWQGLTQEQAAAQLGCPLGTVRSRLARARNLLRRRLTRRGLAPLAGVVAAGLDGATASAATVAWRLSPVPPRVGSFHDPGGGPCRRRTGNGPGGFRRGRFAGSKRALEHDDDQDQSGDGGRGSRWFGGFWRMVRALNGPLAQAQPKMRAKKLESPANKREEREFAKVLFVGPKVKRPS